MASSRSLSASVASWTWWLPIRWSRVSSAYLTPGRTVVADLAGLSFVDSAGLASLVDCYKTARRSGSTFWVRGAHGEVAMVLELTGLCDLLSRPRGA